MFDDQTLQIFGNKCISVCCLGVVTENGCIVNRLVAGVEPNLKSLVLPVELLYVLLGICRCSERKLYFDNSIVIFSYYISIYGFKLAKIMCKYYLYFF